MRLVELMVDAVKSSPLAEALLQADRAEEAAAAAEQFLRNEIKENNGEKAGGIK